MFILENINDLIEEGHNRDRRIIRGKVARKRYNIPLSVKLQRNWILSKRRLDQQYRNKILKAQTKETLSKIRRRLGRS